MQNIVFMHTVDGYLYKEIIHIWSFQIQYHCLPSDNYATYCGGCSIFDVIRPHFMTQGGHYQHDSCKTNDWALSLHKYFPQTESLSNLHAYSLGRLATQSHLQFIDSAFSLMLSPLMIDPLIAIMDKSFICTFLSWVFITGNQRQGYL